MSRENAEARGKRYLGEGRLVVEHIGENLVRGRVRGSGAFYTVTWSSGRRWTCDCPARSRCAHIWALQLVTAVKDPLP